MVQNWQPLFLPNCTGKVSGEASPNSEMGKGTSSLNKRSCQVTLQGWRHRERWVIGSLFAIYPQNYFFIVKVLHHNNGIESKDRNQPNSWFCFCFNPFYPFLEKGMTTHFSILAWKTPWTKEPGRLQSKGLQRVGHDWATEHILCPVHKSH